MPPRSESIAVFACCKRYVAYLFVGVLICSGVARGQEKESASASPQRGVMALIPADREKHAEGSSLSKEERRTATLLRKLRSIEEGGDVNAANKYGQTALMYAAASDDILIVCWLVAKGADVKLVSEKGKSALDYANGARVFKLLRFLNDHTAIPDPPEVLPFPAGSAEYLALHVRFAPQAAEGAPTVPMTTDMTGEGLQLAIALQLPPGYFTPAQQFAASLLQGELSAAASLLEEHPRLLYEHGILRLLNQVGADVNAKDPAGRTLLHRFVNSPEHVAALLRAGAAVNAADKHGRTPLHLAENTNSIRLLAESGAKLNAPDEQGLSPLHIAANSPERVEALIRAGADVNIAMPSGKTPLHITTSARTVQLLLQAGAATRHSWLVRLRTTLPMWQPPPPCWMPTRTQRS